MYILILIIIDECRIECARCAAASRRRFDAAVSDGVGLHVNDDCAIGALRFHERVLKLARIEVVDDAPDSILVVIRGGGRWRGQEVWARGVVGKAKEVGQGPNKITTKVPQKIYEVCLRTS